MSVFGLVVLVVLILIILLFAISAKYSYDRKPDEIHFVKAKDGWSLALGHYRSRKEKKGLFPIVFCHGLGANRFNFDLNDQFTPALMFAEMGYDVFIVELRGVGKSRPESWFYPGKWDICFDDFVEKDIPAILDFVLSKTGAEQVHWLGHSMGAMIGHAISQTEHSRKIRSACSITGPGDLSTMASVLGGVSKLDFLLRPWPALHQSWFVKLYVPLTLVIKGETFLDKWIFNKSNMNMDNARQAGANLIADLPTKLILQFADWVKSGDISSKDGYSYQKNYDKIKIPIFFLSGEADLLAPYESVRLVFESVSSKDKKHVHFSKASGASDYGHGDILFSDNAPLEVYPRIAEWIEEHN